MQPVRPPTSRAALPLAACLVALASTACAGGRHGATTTPTAASTPAVASVAAPASRPPTTSAGPAATAPLAAPPSRALAVARPEGVRVLGGGDAARRLTPSAALAAGAQAVAIVDEGSDGDGRPVTRILIADATGTATRSVGTVDGSWRLPRPVPGGPVEGFAWNGSRVVLEEDGGPHLLAVDVRRASPTHPVQIAPPARGRMAFDALSPDGRVLFVSVDAPDGRTIRAIDLPAGTMRPDPVVMKSAEGVPEGPARGGPVARGESADGRIVATVYTGGAAPFVHVLDAQQVWSLCLDLPADAARGEAGSWAIAVSPDGSVGLAANGALGRAYPLGIASGPAGAGVGLPTPRSAGAPSVAVASGARGAVLASGRLVAIDLAARQEVAPVDAPVAASALVPGPAGGLLVVDGGWNVVGAA